mmetsp:Transcript_70446/g.114473  ORF Transcript_70446/g.114473 Transcript_70446/m.114473 type:complete len:202 (+) Transcript_70446:1390-1995(+)
MSSAPASVAAFHESCPYDIEVLPVRARSPVALPLSLHLQLRVRFRCVLPRAADSAIHVAALSSALAEALLSRHAEDREQARCGVTPSPFVVLADLARLHRCATKARPCLAANVCPHVRTLLHLHSLLLRRRLLRFLRLVCCLYLCRVRCYLRRVRCLCLPLVRCLCLRLCYSIELKGGGEEKERRRWRGRPHFPPPPPPQT